MESVNCRRDHGNVEQEGWFAADGGLSFRCHLWSFRFCYAAISTLISNICIPNPNKETSSLMLESSTSLLVEAIKKKLLTCIDSVIQPMKPLKPTIYI